MTPVVVPYFQLSFVKLVNQFFVFWTLKTRKVHSSRALNYWTTFTQKRKMTILTIYSPKLPSSCNNSQVFAISDKNSTITRGNENKAIVGIIDINISSNIKDKIRTIFTVVKVKLLHFYSVNLLYFKLSLFISKTKLFWIYLLFFSYFSR